VNGSVRMVSENLLRFHFLSEVFISKKNVMCAYSGPLDRRFRWYWATDSGDIGPQIPAALDHG
jgi:hypothetical protein